MVWGTLLGLTGLISLLGRIATRRHEHDPLVMPYQTGHVGWLGEAPPVCHHRLGARRPPEPQDPGDRLSRG
jgi:hypothetical protein